MSPTSPPVGEFESPSMAPPTQQYWQASESRSGQRRRRSKKSSRRRRRNRGRCSAEAAKAISVASMACFAVIGFLTALILVVSENWWFSTALTYLPRTPYAIPPAILLLCAIKWHRRAIWWNLASIVMVIGPLCEYRLPLASDPLDGVVSSNPTIKVVSCNVQGFEPDFSTLLQEISTINPDIVAFQEAVADDSLAVAYFEDWHKVHFEEFWIFSRYPLKQVGYCDALPFDRYTALTVEVAHPAKTFYLTDLHLMTPRKCFSELRPTSILSGAGPQEVEHHLALRREESLLTRAFTSSVDPSVPAVVVGDFNAPSSSSLYQHDWGDYTNAFDEAGCGYGYTAPCRDHSFWLSGTPWLRIDHILATPHWCVRKCQIGHLNGSDHRLITATLSLRDMQSADSTVAESSSH